MHFGPPGNNGGSRNSHTAMLLRWHDVLLLDHSPLPLLRLEDSAKRRRLRTDRNGDAAPVEEVRGSAGRNDGLGEGVAGPNVAGPNVEDQLDNEGR